jgi:hypothetical protein
MNFPLLNNVNIVTMHRGSTAAASANVDSTVHLDMQGYEGVMFAVGIEETTAGGTTGSLELIGRYAESSTDSFTDFSTSKAAAGVNGSITTSDWGKHLVLDIYKPTYRYIGVSLDKDGAASLDNGPIMAIQYGGKEGPITQSSSYVKDSTVSVSPTT